jgi:hypothetical protein
MLVWRHGDDSPLVQNFLTATREVLKQREEATTGDDLLLSSRLT